MKFRVLLVTGICALAVAFWVWQRAGIHGPHVPPIPPPSAMQTASLTPPEEIERFCADCHRFPDPGSFPKDAWYAETKRGFDFHLKSGRTDRHVPPLADVANWFRQAAPETLPTTPELPADADPRFTPAPFAARTGIEPLASGIDFNSTAHGWPGLRLTDMGSGDVEGISVESPDQLPEVESLLAAGHPACSRIVDLDRDGQDDLLVADLGSRLPQDHALGRVLYVPGLRGQSPQILFDQIGRIADVAPADFDQDGDLDLVVAEFGWLETGGVHVLENRRANDAAGPLTAADFRAQRIDPRHGAIHVRPADFNGDGLLDFAVLISQEYETVIAYINDGAWNFHPETIMPPRDPAFGSCSLELMDLDRDGDLDAIYCNGDTLDSHLVKHYHGVDILINDGQFPFRMTRVLRLPGASSSATGDLDGDGDLDIAIAAYLPPHLAQSLPQGTYTSLCWLEQTTPLTFATHVLEVSAHGHLGITSGDFDSDGLLDLATINGSGPNWGAIWWNRRPSK